MHALRLAVGALCALCLPCAAHDWELVREDEPARQLLYIDAGSLSGADGLFLYLSTAGRAGPAAQRLVWHRADCAQRRLGSAEVRPAGPAAHAGVLSRLRWSGVAQVTGNGRYAWKLLCAPARAAMP